MTTPAAQIDHRPNCRNPDVLTFKGDHGDTIARCRRCGRHAVVLESAEPRTPADASTTPTSWRCREHPGTSVDWRGRGCTKCQRERADRRNEPKHPTTQDQENRS